MNPYDRAAQALAYAFLDGEWTGDGLVRRGSLVLGHQRNALGALVRSVLRAYPRPPWDRVREFAAWLAANDLEDEPHGLLIADFHPRRWLPFQPAMGEMPWRVPAIPTLGELSHFFDVSATQLEWLSDVRSLERRVADDRLRHYRYRWVRKKAGGTRLIESPKERLRTVQRHLLHAILDHIPAHASAHGFVRGRSALTFAFAHTDAEVVVRLDLADFFGSISAGRVFGVFRTAGYPESVAHVITGLTTNTIPLAVWQEAPAAIRQSFMLGKKLGQPHLPQGAPTSPALANLCAHGLDRRLSGLASSFGMRYSRYADDLALSGSVNREAVTRVIELAKQIARDEGFQIREAKTLVMAKGHRQRLAGIVVNKKLNVDRQSYDVLRATLYNASRNGLDAENQAHHEQFAEHLSGRVSWVTSVNPNRAQKLQPLLASATRNKESP